MHIGVVQNFPLPLQSPKFDILINCQKSHISTALFAPSFPFNHVSKMPSHIIHPRLDFWSHFHKFPQILSIGPCEILPWCVYSILQLCEFVHFPPMALFLHDPYSLLHTTHVQWGQSPYGDHNASDRDHHCGQ